MTAAWLSNSQVSAYVENCCQTMAQEREGGKLGSPPDWACSQSSPFPTPSSLGGHLPCFPASRFVCRTEVVTLHTPLGETKGGRRVAEGLGRGSQGNRMNLFSEKHGVQTGGFLLSCFSSVKASINSTLIIKSEQCVSGFQQLNSVTAVSLGSLASFTT